jgi:hypothetical protein
MSNNYRFFKSNIINGCRLADIDVDVTRDKVFFLEYHVAQNSRSVSAALKAGWILEINEKEASLSINIPKASESRIQNTVLKTEESKGSSIDTRMNIKAMERHQERLKKIEMRHNDTSYDNEDVSVPEIKPGKNSQVNLAATARIEARQKKHEMLEKKKKGFLKEEGHVQSEEMNTKLAISEQIRKNRNDERRKILLKTDVSEDIRKQEIQEDIDRKLEEKIENARSRMKKNRMKRSSDQDIDERNISETESMEVENANEELNLKIKEEVSVSENIPEVTGQDVLENKPAKKVHLKKKEKKNPKKGSSGKENKSRTAKKQK